jgi:excisionase family DNA binding protein
LSAGGSLSGEQLSLLELIKPDLPQKTLLRVDEVARFFNINKKTVYGWVDMGILQACNPNGGSLRVFRESVMGLMKRSMK